MGCLEQNYAGKRPQRVCRGGQETNVPATSNNSYGTVTGQGKHCRTCSSRTFYITLYRDLARSSYNTSPGASQKDFHTSTKHGIFRMLTRGPQKDTKSSKKVDVAAAAAAAERILPDFDTRISQEPPTRAVIQTPLRHGTCEICMHRITQGHWGRICLNRRKDVIKNCTTSPHKVRI